MCSRGGLLGDCKPHVNLLPVQDFLQNMVGNSFYRITWNLPSNCFWGELRFWILDLPLPLWIIMQVNHEYALKLRVTFARNFWKPVLNPGESQVIYFLHENIYICMAIFLFVVTFDWKVLRYQFGARKKKLRQLRVVEGLLNRKKELKESEKKGNTRDTKGIEVEKQKT